MQKVKIAVKGNRAVLLGSIELIAGTVGQQCEFYFDDEWNSLQKFITYKLGSNIIGSYSFSGNQATIPSAVLKTAGLPLSIGLAGRSADGSVVIPTSWCLLGPVRRGTIITQDNGAGGGGNDDDDDDEIIYDGGSV
jgi:hypothetical protein